MTTESHGKYILDGHTPVPENDVIKWALWYEHADEKRKVRQEKVIYRRWLVGSEEAKVSTIFLGLDYSFSLGSVPILFETMVIGGKYDGYQERYATWEEAEVGHEIIVARLKSNWW